MMSHSVRRHRSAASIVREFLGPQLAVLPEELVWVPAHPSHPEEDGFSYAEMLRAVRRQRHWAFVRVPKDPDGVAVVHFYAARDVPARDVARMLGHELGHISGDILDDDAAEERRADLYGEVAARVLGMMLTAAGSGGRRRGPSASARRPRTPRGRKIVRRRGR